jgi:hypothetical protein
VHVETVTTSDQTLLAAVRATLQRAADAFLCVAFVQEKGLHLLEPELVGLQRRRAGGSTWCSRFARKPRSAFCGGSNEPRASVAGVAWSGGVRRSVRASGVDAVKNPVEHLVDPVGAYVGVEEAQGHLPRERLVRVSEPAMRCGAATEDAARVSRDAGEAKDPLGLD